MATYTFWFDALPGRNDITAKLFGQTGGAMLGSASAVEDATDKGRYSAAITTASPLAAGMYSLSGWIGTQPGFANKEYNVQAPGNQISIDEQAVTASASVTVLPVAVRQLDSEERSTLVARTGEQRVIAFIVEDADGAEVDLDGKTLRVVIESQSSDKTQYVREDGEITHSGGSVSFVLHSAVTASPRAWNWSLRDVSIGAGDTVIKDGELIVSYSPKKT